MTDPCGSGAVHFRYCAARNKKTATVFFGFSALEVAWHWGAINGPLPQPRASVFLFVGLIGVVVLMFDLMLSLTCFRERLVLALSAASFLIVLTEQLSPALTEAVLVRTGQLVLALWIVATIASASLLISAVGWPRPSGSAKKRP